LIIIVDVVSNCCVEEGNAGSIIPEINGIRNIENNMPFRSLYRKIIPPKIIPASPATIKKGIEIITMQTMSSWPVHKQRIKKNKTERTGLKILTSNLIKSSFGEKIKGGRPIIIGSSQINVIENKPAKSI